MGHPDRYSRCYDGAEPIDVALLPRRGHVCELDAAADAVQAQPAVHFDQCLDSALQPDGTPPATGERGRSTTSPESSYAPTRRRTWRVRSAHGTPRGWPIQTPQTIGRGSRWWSWSGGGGGEWHRQLSVSWCRCAVTMPKDAGDCPHPWSGDFVAAGGVGRQDAPTTSWSSNAPCSSGLPHRTDALGMRPRITQPVVMSNRPSRAYRRRHDPPPCRRRPPVAATLALAAVLGGTRRPCPPMRRPASTSTPSPSRLLRDPLSRQRHGDRGRSRCTLRLVGAIGEVWLRGPLLLLRSLRFRGRVAYSWRGPM